MSSEKIFNIFNNNGKFKRLALLYFYIVLTLFVFNTIIPASPALVFHFIQETIFPSSQQNKASYAYNTSSYFTPYSSMQNDIDSLKEDVQSLKGGLSNATGSANIKILDGRVTKLEERENALEQTILVDADKALTSRYLRDKQIEVDNELKDVKSSQLALNNRLDNLLYIPLFGLFITLIGSAIVYLIQQIFHRNKHKPEDTPAKQ